MHHQLFELLEFSRALYDVFFVQLCAEIPKLPTVQLKRANYTYRRSAAIPFSLVPQTDILQNPHKHGPIYLFELN